MTCLVRRAHWPITLTFAAVWAAGGLAWSHLRPPAFDAPGPALTVLLCCAFGAVLGRAASGHLNRDDI